MLLKTAVLILLCIMIMTAGLVSLKHGISRYMYSLCTCLCPSVRVCAWMLACVYYHYVVPSRGRQVAEESGIVSHCLIT